ncbi:MAG: endonuclease [Clostridiales bacterium 43-6]|nr:MAG: endonuclease [Clostridiales bacterium 43-6]
MNLSVSNIAWASSLDHPMYEYIREQGFSGLEIAPTRIFPENPYEDLTKAKAFREMLFDEYSLVISSMQSIWFGKTERIFASKEERHILIEYTKKAIDFAAVIGCGNLVFGCPKNRIADHGDTEAIAVDFFGTLGEYAVEHNTVLSMEPNPAIYGTNYINYTKDAFTLVKQINSKGFLVNVDLGTIIENGEDLTVITDNLSQVNHVHISEPYLERIQKRQLHNTLADILQTKGYDKFISIEMKKQDKMKYVHEAMQYIKEVFV